MTPTPIPSPSAEIVLPVDPSRVTPGLYGFLSLLFLIVAVIALYLSMRKQLSKINFDEDAVPAGVRPLPPYATKAERRKTAQRIEADKSAKVAARQARRAAANPDAQGQSAGAAGTLAGGSDGTPSDEQGTPAAGA
ncbi:MAG: hypothetical protein RLZ55_1100 [Actinomycetota bacterium]